MNEWIADRSTEIKQHLAYCFNCSYMELHSNYVVIVCHSKYRSTQMKQQTILCLAALIHVEKIGKGQNFCNRTLICYSQKKHSRSKYSNRAVS